MSLASDLQHRQQTLAKGRKTPYHVHVSGMTRHGRDVARYERPTAPFMHRPVVFHQFEEHFDRPVLNDKHFQPHRPLLYNHLIQKTDKSRRVLRNTPALSERAAERQMSLIYLI